MHQEQIPSTRSTPIFLHGHPKRIKPQNAFFILKWDYI